MTILSLLVLGVIIYVITKHPKFLQNSILWLTETVFGFINRIINPSIPTAEKLKKTFQDKGFATTELIATRGSISPTGIFDKWKGLENPIFNIIIGVKDGKLSFFGGGYLGMLTVKSGAVAVEKSYLNVLSVEKKDFSHLFDIPISEIARIVPTQGKNIVILDIFEKSDKRTRLCFHYMTLDALNIGLANILMGAFEIILETESISNVRISQINEDIQAACKAGNEEALKTILKAAGAIILVGAVVAGATAAAVSRAGKDIGSSPRSSARYQGTETGNLYDEGGNVVPF